MKVTVDSKVSLKHKLSMSEMMAILLIKNCAKPQACIDNLLARGILEEKEGMWSITPQWEDITNTVLLDSSGAIDDENRLKALALKMQECYPSGKMPGTPYFYKCNVREIVLKLKRFFEKYGNYLDEDIVDATKRYIASFNGNYKYLPLIKYFISKNKLMPDEDGVNHVTEESPLATFLENKEEETLVTASDDWMMNTRN